MAEFKLGRIRFVWQGDWTASQTYYKDDIVRYGGKTYLCVIGHVANGDFYSDLENVPSRWNQVTDGQEWKGDWTQSVYYKQNDIVKYGGYLYICNNGHTSASTADQGLEFNQSDWDIYAESFDYKTSWNVSTRYKVNDVVKYGGNSYICNEGHTSAATETAGLEADLSKWDIYAESFNWIGEWTTNTRYKINDIVTYGGTTYVCNEGHTSAGTITEGLELDQLLWDYMNKGTDYKGDWSNSNVRYKVNDLVKYGAGVWICTQHHTSNTGTTFSADQNSGRWAQYVEGLEFNDTWTSGTIYQPGDIVAYGGYSYQALTNHTASGGQPPSTNTIDWVLYTTGLRFQGDWNSGTSYRVGDVIRLNGYTYVAIADSLNQVPPNLSKWERLNSGIQWKGQWVDDFSYVLGDAVRYGNNSYVCVLAHLSEGDDGSTLTPGQVNSRPDQDVNGTYWNLLSGGPEESVLTTTGDLVYYSGSGPARLPIGDQGQVLRVSPEGIPEWVYYGVVSRLVYVAPHGVDNPAPEYGLTLDRPWASIRYACEQIEKGYENPQAGILLKNNRAFIQAEVAEWVDRQIIIGTGIWSGFTNDNKDLCTRDVGLLVDALVYDITHGGNSKTIETALTYFDPVTGDLIASLTDEAVQGVAAIEYALTLINYILINDAPGTNYQTLNGVVDPVLQFVNSIDAESGVLANVTALVSIVTDAMTAGNSSALPSEVKPSWTVNIKTGQYREVLPIIVPARTGLVGDELRGTEVKPSGKLIATTDKAKTVATLQYLQSITEDVITKTTVTPKKGTGTQNVSMKGGNVGSADAVDSVVANVAEMIDIVDNGLSAVDAFVYPDPTGYDSGYSNARRLILANKSFLISEVSAWINAQIAGDISPFENFTYGGAQQTSCERDVGYIVDALVYDLTYGGNLETSVAARSYYSQGVFVETGEKEQALAVQARIKDIIDNIATGDSAGWTKTTGLTQDVSGTPGSSGAASFAQARIQEIYDTIDTGVEPTPILPDTSWVANDLVKANTHLQDSKTTIQNDSVQHVKKTFPTLVFNETLCSRDVGYIVDALGYDLMFGSNFRSIKAAMSYYRALSSTAVVLGPQKDAQLSMLSFVLARVKPIVASGAVVAADLIWQDVINYINTGTEPQIVGTNRATDDVDIHNGAILLAVNKDFLAAEATGYITSTFIATATATSSSNNEITVSTTSWMVANDPITFSGSTFGGIEADEVYYIKTIGSGVITISSTVGGSTIALTDGSGILGVNYHYDTASCERDVRAIVEAMSYDLQYPGNYKSHYAARYYRNALTGSKLENMYLVRNGCGIRNMTLMDLDGTSDGHTSGAGSATGLTAPNEFGTSRPLAGAYVSLDPGWGPNDSRAWTTDKSTYVQNVTTFGTACTGQKIDGSLHNGGNDSIVSNDFTQVLSDGIGAWVSNLGRAELVSVFTYYNHIGYLSENGGKIRATNGNNSYGDFGSVAEGIDVTEEAVTGTVNNRNTEATVGNVYVDGDQILAFEFENAGQDYSSATYTISGPGINAAAVGDEIRFGGVFEARLTDPGDSSGPGGTGYITSSNLAQAGTTTQITLANTEAVPSLAYVGMSIYLTTGTGAGQYGVIATYNAPTKVATVVKESDGSPGWDHVIPGSTIESSLDVTTAYTISPRLSLSAPTYTTAKTSILPSADAWKAGTYGNAEGAYTSVATTTLDGGTLASFNVSRRDGIYILTLQTAGIGYDVDDTLTIAGTDVGGSSPENDITITITSVDPTNANAIITFSYTGTAISSKFVAVSSTGTSAAYSTDGTTWEAATLPSGSWTDVAYGLISGIGIYVAVSSTDGKAASSIDGITWTERAMPTTSAWSSVTYGNGRFVAVANGSNDAAYSTNGTTWTAMSALPGSNAAWTSVTYGKGLYVAVASGGTQAASSTNGTTWSSRTLSASASWTSVTYGKNRFVAVASGGTAAAYSLNGTTWTNSEALPASADWNNVSYGNGIYYAVATGSVAATSEDGINWTSRSTVFATPTVTNTAKDIIGTFVASTLPNTGYWTDVIWTGTKFVAVGHNNNDTAYGASSTDGSTWTAVTIPSDGGYEFVSIAYNGTNRYVAFLTNDRDTATSTDGVSWTTQTNALPQSRTWKDSTFGGGKFVVVGSGGTNPAMYSADGTTWTQGTIANTTWTSVTYGQPGATAYYVAVSTTQAAAYSTDGIAWTSGNTLPSSDVWSSVTYGNGTFVAVAGDSATATTKAAYSTNGTTWSAATLPGVAAKWVSVSYGGGTFMAFEYGGTRTAISTDGITWTEGPSKANTNTNTSAYGTGRFVSLATEGSTAGNYINYILDTNYLTTSDTSLLSPNDRIIFGETTIGGVVAGTVYYIKTVNSATTFTISGSLGGSTFVLSSGSGTMPSTVSKNYVDAVYGIGKWLVLSPDNTRILTTTFGARARARSYVSDNKITSIWIQEPGGGYTVAPTLTITDPNNTGADASVTVRIGNGVLASPSFTNRGTGFTSSTAQITGNGFADKYQVGTLLYVNNLLGRPFEGSNLQIDGIDDVYYRVVQVTQFLGRLPGEYSARLQISPAIAELESPENGAAITLRRRYSQVRLTGHDFLQVGTGNKTLTNYPDLPLQDPVPANETVDAAGGRVFYTSTDQDGNFRVGGLFNVEQATGVATLNADAFNLAGLNELQLGSVALGGAGAIVSEFSTDPFFTADSDNVVPTQRAIKAYISSQIGGGGSSLNVNSLTAGVIYIAGNSITTTTEVQININTKVNFLGGVDGSPVALNYFLLG
jgi:hypothetical protein